MGMVRPPDNGYLFSGYIAEDISLLETAHNIFSEKILGRNKMRLHIEENHRSVNHGQRGVDEKIYIGERQIFVDKRENGIITKIIKQQRKRSKKEYQGQYVIGQVFILFGQN